MAQYAKVQIPISPASLSFNTAVANPGVQLKSGPGVLVSINVNTIVAASTITLYDGTSTAGKKLGTWNTGTAAPAQALANFAFTNGLFAVVVGTSDVTVGYR
jgi:hypothetical protein